VHGEQPPPERPAPVAASDREVSQQRPPRHPGRDTGEHRYFDDEQSANTESEVQLDGFDRDRFRVAPALVVAGVCLAALAGVLWLGGRDTATEAAQSISSGGKAPSQASAQGPELAVANVRAVLDELGMQNVVVDSRDGVVHVGGPVSSQADLDSVSAAVKAVAGEYEVDTSALVVLEPGSTESPVSTTPAPAAPVAGAGSALLQSELDRILAVTPLIFDTGQADLTALHQRALNSVVLVLQNQPEGVVTITGYTDEEGTNSANRQISLSRAENVKAYLVSQGISAEALSVDARGEESATGSSALAGLERRVEFEVQTAPGGAAKTGPIRVALVAPSAMNDLAFTQSMVLPGVPRATPLVFQTSTHTTPQRKKVVTCSARSPP
jgi:outer membrane protein OmpA-like peptidoglycan-associated protein